MPREPLPGRWITVDIGESTGWAVMEEDRLVDSGTTEMWDFCRSVGHELAFDAVSDTLDARLDGWELLVVEDWQLDPSKALSLAWDTQDTVRGLGALEFIAWALGRRFSLQSRTIKPAAKAAGAEDLFVHPLHENRHRNDAVMHAVHFAGLRGKALVAAE